MRKAKVLATLTGLFMLLVQSPVSAETASTLSGVLQTSSGAPTSGNIDMYSATLGGYSQTVTSNGLFSILVPPGTYTVHFDLNLNTSSEELYLANDYSTVDLSTQSITGLVIKPTQNLVPINVTDSAGKPVTGATITMQSSSQCSNAPIAATFTGLPGTPQTSTFLYNVKPLNLVTNSLGVATLNLPPCDVWYWASSLTVTPPSGSGAAAVNMAMPVITNSTTINVRLTTLTMTSQAPLTITNSNLNGTVGTPIALTASGGSGVIAPIFSVEGSNCTITGYQLSASQPTTCAVTATNPGNGRYQSISAAPLNFTFALPKVTPTTTTTIKKTVSVTITCVKGKLLKKLTAAKPVCPAGYKKK